ncbi:uncharacterized protein EI90DRAFT_139546 [Cantharellus anzutake]|uniref:uncharacterized protein n=1 Tax=Cantharellus anzutake TaxID=1750568 RepID=UPI001905FFB8|nr:uncharacterized protein EI90DRAFT_139546 [Cantharellus anzutake]KAF8317754.1 hypothetical protein EI90DRAFT_139546 [Cantharellus anzutake]
MKNYLYPGGFGRVEEYGFFQTTNAVISPLHRQGQCLHPSQRRVLTVREYARAQGFSDSTDFKSVLDQDEDVSRHIDIVRGRVIFVHGSTEIPYYRECITNPTWYGNF